MRNTPASNIDVDNFGPNFTRSHGDSVGYVTSVAGPVNHQLSFSVCDPVAPVAQRVIAVNVQPLISLPWPFIFDLASRFLPMQSLVEEHREPSYTFEVGPREAEDDAFVRMMCAALKEPAYLLSSLPLVSRSRAWPPRLVMAPLDWTSVSRAWGEVDDVV